MAGSSFGTRFTVTSWGESHGKALGVVVDGCPAGLPLSEEIVQPYLDRRKPGSNPYATKRAEGDRVEILSGVFEGKTTGTPIAMMVRNEAQRSADYSQIASIYRPGHADYPYEKKYGIRDYRGGGRSSGRETLARVAGGAVASEILHSLGISLRCYARSIGPVHAADERFDWDFLPTSPVVMPDPEASARAEAYLREQMAKSDSAGGVIECVVYGLPVGVGEPVFDKLDACLAKAVLSIGAVKGVEFGDGFAAAASSGSQNNDPFCIDAAGAIRKKTNHSGGILGGLSDGAPLILRAAVKPTPSIASPQQTVNQSGEEVTVQIKGRHDPIIVPRAVVVVESMTAITLVDLLLAGATSRIDYLKKIYG